MLRRIAIAAVVLLALMIVGDVASSVFFPHSACDQNTENQSGAEKRCGFAESITYRSVEVTVDWIDRKSGFVTAASTFFIGLFTLTLWLSTRGMLQATNQPIKLAREEFISAHRPKIIVYGFDIQFADDGPAPVHFRYVNIGDSTAFVTEVGTRVLEMTGNLLNPGIEFVVEQIKPPIEIKIGQHGFRMTDDKGKLLTAIFSDGPDPKLVCIGYIAYKDSNGTIRQTGFCRKYDSLSHRWLKIDDEDYEYAY